MMSWEQVRRENLTKRELALIVDGYLEFSEKKFVLLPDEFKKNKREIKVKKGQIK